MSYDDKVKKLIAAEVRMISGCHDNQTSADVSNVGRFSLPNPQGMAGGACTAALLQVLYKAQGEMSFVDILRRMREVLVEKGFDQVPQLSSSRIIDVRNIFSLINPNEELMGGTRRAVLIGINYTGQDGQLSGCHNDVKNMNKYLTEVQGFRPHNITILMDDGMHENPTYKNIWRAYKDLVKKARGGDSLFIHYSGHGGRVRDTSGDEDDGYDETLIPVDFMQAGQIVDDDLFDKLIKPLPANCQMTSLMDCCHSGTVLDLPYRFTADGDVEAGMERTEGFNFGSGALAAGACCCFEMFSFLSEFA